MSVCEFMGYIRGRKFGEIYYLSENQNELPNSDDTFPVRVQMRYDTITAWSNPNRVVLKNAGGCQAFNYVRSVGVDDESSVLGTLITILCGYKMEGRYIEKQYILVAR